MIHGVPLVMIPGPTPVAESIRQAMAGPTYGHTYGPFVTMYKDCIAGLKQIFQAEAVVVIGGAGTLSMEMALINVVRPGEAILVITHGMFGDRFAAVGKALGLEVDILDCPWGEPVCLTAVEERLASKKYAAVTLTHVDTSTGVVSDPEQVGALARQYDTLFILDGVCASAGIPEPMQEFNIDIIVTTCQKAFGTPPGLTMLGLSAKALARREELGTVRGYYTDWKNWLPIMDNPGLYFATPPVNLIMALNQSVKIILDEGLEARYARHERIARSIRAGLKELNLELVTAATALAPTLTVLRYPAGVDDGEFRAKMEQYDIVVAGGVGALKGKAFRIGHMGNICINEIVLTLYALERALTELGCSVTPGAAVGAAWSEWHKG